MTLRALLLAPLLACATTPPAGPRPSDVAPPTEMLTYPARVTESSLAEAILEFPFEVETELDGPMRLGAARYELYVEGEPSVAGAVALTESARGPGRLRSRLNAKARFSTDTEAFARRRRALLNYRLSAEIEVETATGQELFDAEWSGEMFAPQRPTLDVTVIGAKTGGALELMLHLEVSNPNAFALRVEHIEYVVSIAGERVATGELAHLSVLSPRSETVFELSKRLDRGSHPGLLRRTLQSAQVTHHTVAHLRLEDELSLTLTHDGQAHFSR